MKISEQWAVGLLLFVMISLPIGHAGAQSASSGVSGVSSVAVCVPLKTDEVVLSQLSSSASGSSANQELWWRIIGEMLERPQTLSNGGAFPEAASLARLMEASLSSEASLATIRPIDIDALKAMQAEKSVTSILQAKELQNVDAAVLMLYTVQDYTIQFGALFLTKTGQEASYFSGALSVFGLAEGTREAVNSFVAKKMLVPKAQASKVSLASGHASSVPSTLPVIEPWKDRTKYEQANSRFQFSIGGVAVGLSASMVSLGFWQAYREAAYRNTAFEGAVTASTIATGACVAATAAFLASAIWNAVLMLQASH